ncbi:MAG: Gfo/Idh/MocA family oxidoreductase [Patescibacteria group bacterium]|nr:Gfo/Idh/MocA family oxidoreductase [Patescibacteria group bacterium]
MESKVRIAVLGTGWWACEAHLPAIQKHPNAELVAVQKRKREDARKVADDFGAQHACTTVDEVLAIDGLDAVIISSTPNMHFEQTKAALERGLHVLIEKPMTFTAAEAKLLVELAKSKDLQFLISCPFHYTAHSIAARKLIQSGALGRVKMISVLYTNFSGGLYYGKSLEQIFSDSPALENAPRPYLEPCQNSYSDPAIAGGGQIYCQVSHAAAHIGFLTGRRPTEVFARFDNGDANVDVYNTLNIKLDDGTLVSIASTGATMLPERNNEVRVYGTEGMLFMELWKGKLTFHDSKEQVTRYEDLAEDDIYPMYSPANNLVEAVLGTSPNGSPAELGLFAMEIIEAACKSAQSNMNMRVAEL